MEPTQLRACRRRTPLVETRQLVHTITLHTLENGLVLTLCAGGNLAVYYARKPYDDNVHEAFRYIVGQLYAFVLVASLGRAQTSAQGTSPRASMVPDVLSTTHSGSSDDAPAAVPQIGARSSTSFSLHPGSTIHLGTEKSGDGSLALPDCSSHGGGRDLDNAKCTTDLCEAQGDPSARMRACAAPAGAEESQTCAEVRWVKGSADALSTGRRRSSAAVGHP